MQILLRYLFYSTVKPLLPKLRFGTVFSVIEMLSSRECNRRYRANRIAAQVHQAGLGDCSKLPVVHFALAVSAYFEPAIRVLHTFQAFIYLAVIAGALRHQKWGYGAGIS